MTGGQSAYPDVDDPELLRLHADGDSGAFAELVTRHRDRLWAVALRTVGEPEEAADALQDALVSAYRAAAGFQGRSAVTTWLHRIVVNACLDRLRRRAARPSVPLPEDLDQRLPAPPQDDPVIRGEEREVVLRALATLPPEQRAALVLVDMQGCPVDEAASILRVPTGTVKSRCARGRARLLPLVRHLREHPDEPGPRAVAGGDRSAQPPPPRPPRPTSPPRNRVGRQFVASTDDTSLDGGEVR